MTLKNKTESHYKSNNSTLFSELPLSPNTAESIQKMGFTSPTPIQSQCIPLLLNGGNVVAAAKTGSGKTLAFLIPAVEILSKGEFKQEQGTGVLIISPTRELAVQIHAVAKTLLEGQKTLTLGLIMGGCNRNQEIKKLKKNLNVLVATPGRLLDHLKNTKNFKIDNLRFLVIDEADRILDNGFEEEMKQILSRLPKDRQTGLFSATQTKRTKDLVKLSFKDKPTLVDVDHEKEHSTRVGLTQGYVKVEANDKFLLLYSFLKRNTKKKTIVFLSTCAATKFYAHLLNLVDVPVLSLHGKLKQGKRTATFFEFMEASSGILLATDVAARGLDIPSVDWIIQFDPPDNPKSYIHRVGRTARGLNGLGKALLFLLPEEMNFLKKLDEMKVPIQEMTFPSEGIADVQKQLEKLVGGNYYLENSARNAYRSYLQSYAQMSLKEVFDVHSLDMLKVAKAFGFDAPPKISLNISLGGKKTRKRLLQMAMGKGQLGGTVKQFCR